MQTPQQIISAFYLSYYGRPADPTGITYWTGLLNQAGGNLDEIINVFSNSPEATSRFGKMTHAERIESLYQDLFGRQGEPAGAAYWVGEVTAGRISIAQLANKMYLNALGIDVTTLAVRQQVADQFTAALPANSSGYAGPAAIEAARLMLQASSATTSAADIATLAKAGITLAASTTADPAIITALTGTNGKLLDLLLTPAGKAEPVALVTLLSEIMKTTGGNSASVTTLLDDRSLTDALNNLPPGVTLTGLETAIDNGGFKDGWVVLNPSNPGGGGGGSGDGSGGGGSDNSSGGNFAATADTDKLIGTAGNDSFLGTNLTIGALDSIDGAGGIDTLTITQSTTGAYTLPAVTLTDVEKLLINSAGGAVVADVQSAVGLKEVAIVLTAAADVDVTTKSNVQSVTITNAANSPTVTDNGSSATTADTLASVTLVGSTANAAISSDALTTLNLTNTAHGATIAADAAATRTLTLGLNDVTGGTITDATATTLNVNSTGKATTGVTLSAAAATTVAINADEKLTITDINLAAAKTITVVGDSAVVISATTGVAALESISSVGSTGGVTVTPALGTGVAFTGGDGKDSVSVAAGHTTAVNLGAGDDTVNIVGALGAGGSVDGGTGSNTVAMTAAVAASATSALLAGITGFEKVQIGQVAAGQATSIDMANLNNLNYIASAGVAAGAGGALNISNLASGGTVELTGAIGAASSVAVTGAAGNANDELNIKLNGTANTTNTAALTVSQVQTIRINATDSSVDTTALTNPAAASTLWLAAADATTIFVTGNHGVDFTGSTLTNVTSLDASGVVSQGNAAGATAAQIGTTGAVTFTSAATGNAVTVSTGNGADVINVASALSSTVTTGAGDDRITGSAGVDTINAGAGADTITGGANADLMTGGAGKDSFAFASADSGTPSATNFDTITDWNTGGDNDGITFAGGTLMAGTNAAAATSAVASISIAGFATFNSADVSLAQRITATEAGIHAGGNTAGEFAVFESGTNSYVFISDGVAGVGADDVLIQLQGATGLDTSSTTGGLLALTKFAPPNNQAAPQMQSAVVNTDGRTLTITYSQAVAGNLEFQDWTLRIPQSSNPISLTGAAIDPNDAKKVILTLPGQFPNNLTISSITYTATGGGTTDNSLVDQANSSNPVGGQSLTTNIVNNSTFNPGPPPPPPPQGDNTQPEMQSAVVSEDGLSIVITYSETLAGTPEAADFRVTIPNISDPFFSYAGTISDATMSGSTITLAMSAVIPESATISGIGYYFAGFGTQSGSIKDLAGNPQSTQNLDGVKITNNSNATVDMTAPGMISAVLGADGKTLTLTYSEEVAGTLEAADWVVTAKNTTNTVANAVLHSTDATKIVLTLTDTLLLGENVNAIQYTKSGGGTVDNSVVDKATPPNPAYGMTLGQSAITSESTVVIDGYNAPFRFVNASSYNGALQTPTFADVHFNHQIAVTDFSGISIQKLNGNITINSYSILASGDTIRINHSTPLTNDDYVKFIIGSENKITKAGTAEKILPIIFYVGHESVGNTISAQNDTMGVKIFALGGNNTITGSVYNDEINAREGSDIFWGGTGSDIFNISSTDSTKSYGTDELKLDTMKDWNFGGDRDTVRIGPDIVLSGNSLSDALAGNAKIAQNGFATFHADDDTLIERITAVAEGLKEGGTKMGELAFFHLDGHSYVFASNNQDNFNYADTVIKFENINATTLEIIGSDQISLY